MTCDNYATRMHAEIRAWLAKNPRVTLHFTPTGCSWINLVECFFSVITRQAIRHRQLERAPRPVHLDQRPRRDTRRHQTRED